MNAVQLRPNFSRTWPDCQEPMRLIMRHLYGLGATDGEIVAALKVDFPGHEIPIGQGEPWRRDVLYDNLVQLEKRNLERHPELYQHPDEPTDYELQVVSSPQDIIALCQRYRIYVRLDMESEQLALSRKIVHGGPLWGVLARYGPALIGHLGRAFVAP